jgi:hypothetical protein
MIPLAPLVPYIDAERIHIDAERIHIDAERILVGTTSPKAGASLSNPPIVKRG